MHRHKIENWGVTFPKHTSNKETFADLFPPSKYSLVCEELHEDGTPHLHAALRLTKGLTHQAMIKWLQVKFPKDWKRIKVEGIKNWDQWHTYCQKEDPATIIKGTLDGTAARAKMLAKTDRLFRESIGVERCLRVDEAVAAHNAYIERDRQSQLNQRLWYADKKWEGCENGEFW